MVDASLGVIAGNHVWFTKSHAENQNIVETAKSETSYFTSVGQ